MRSLAKHARILLRGLTEPNEWSTDISFRNYLPIQNMLQRCIEFLPILKQAHFDPQERLHVDPRPQCNEHVRLKLEGETQIVHNYVRGGSGVTLSWRCAKKWLGQWKRY